MARSVNKVILVGNLGKDAETKFTPNGVARTSFTLATSRRWKDQQTGEWKEETEWHNVVLWRSENVATYLTKGKQVYIEGRIQSRSFDDKDGNKRYFTDIVAEELMLLGGRGGDGPSEGGGYDAPAPSGPVSMPRSAQRPRQAPAASPAADLGDQGISDDDVPF